MFWSNKKDKIKNADKVLTWLIIGSVVASVFWVATKTKKWKEVTSGMKKWALKTNKKIASTFWSVLAKTVWLFSKKK